MKGLAFVIKKENGLICVILAGGKGTRLDGKGKLNQYFNNKSLLENVYLKIKNQFSDVAINLNNKETDIKIKTNLVYDIYFDNVGPLAGIHAAIKFSYEKIGKDGFVCTVPVDTPFLPSNLGKKLYECALNKNCDVVVAKSGSRKHPTVAVWKNYLLVNLEKSIENGVRKIDIFTSQLKLEYVNWKINQLDPFFNINDHEDLKIARNMLNIKKQ